VAGDGEGNKRENHLAQARAHFPRAKLDRRRAHASSDASRIGTDPPLDPSVPSRLVSSRLVSSRLVSSRLGSARLGSARLGLARFGAARRGGSIVTPGYEIGNEL